MKLAADACLPLINAVLYVLKAKAYPEGSFLNIDVPTDVAYHKGFKITKQGKFMTRIGSEQTYSSTPALESYQTANMNIDSAPGPANNASSALVEDELLFKRAPLLQQKNVLHAKPRNKRGWNSAYGHMVLGLSCNC
ncbi:unnamed protein product [Musa textilis]